MHIHYDNIGEVNYKVSARAKRVNIRLQPFKGVQVSYPPYLSISQAESVVLKNAAWITKKLNLIKEREAHYSIDENYEWYSVYHTYKLKKNNAEICQTFIRGSVVEILYPEKKGLRHPEVREFISNFLEGHLRKSAKIYLPGRLDHFSNKKGIYYQKLRINKARTRWGSCSSRNNINLSLYLMLLPSHLIDYVILHELAHIKEKNHSSSFWKHLEEICPHSQSLDRELNQLKLFIP